jgi:hypothetical protein
METVLFLNGISIMLQLLPFQKFGIKPVAAVWDREDQLMSLAVLGRPVKLSTVWWRLSPPAEYKWLGHKWGGGGEVHPFGIYQEDTLPSVHNDTPCWAGWRVWAGG